MVQFVPLAVTTNEQVPDRTVIWPMDFPVRSFGIEFASAVAKTVDGGPWAPTFAVHFQIGAKSLAVKLLNLDRWAQVLHLMASAESQAPTAGVHGSAVDLLQLSISASLLVPFVGGNNYGAIRPVTPVICIPSAPRLKMRRAVDTPTSRLGAAGAGTCLGDGFRAGQFPPLACVHNSWYVRWRKPLRLLLPWGSRQSADHDMARCTMWLAEGGLIGFL